MSLFYNSSEAIIITSVYIKLINFLLSFPQLFYLIQVHFNLGQFLIESGISAYQLRLYQYRGI